MDVLPVPDVAASREIGQAAVRAMLALAHASPIGAVIESNLYRSTAVEQLRQLPGDLIEVFCRCDEDTAAARYMTRAGTRHAGQFDHIRERTELWNDEVAEPVNGGWPVIEVDTCAPVDLDAIVRTIKQLA
jgi:hypothetical protein